MPFLKEKCPQCNKDFESIKEYVIGGKNVYVGKCGHFKTQDQLSVQDASTIVSLDGKVLRPFQIKTVSHMEESGGRDLIGHEMGLGKTVCVLAFLALHPEACKFIIVCKSTLKTQWQHEAMRWMGENVFCQIIEDSKTPLLPFANGYIVSYDLLRRLKDFPERLVELGVKTLIADECQQIKNSESSRTEFVRMIARQMDYFFPMSGTAIKNNAGEYFPVLNLLSPQMFPKLSSFQYYWCDSYNSGYGIKVGGLKNPALFREKTEKFIIRYTREEVAPELPVIDRQFSFHELSKEVQGRYRAALEQFQDAYDDVEGNSFEETGNILAYLSKMRHLAGLSLIDPAIDHTMEFLGSTDRKLCIFVHHKDVGEILQMKLSGLCQELGVAPPMNLTSSLSPDARAQMVLDFKAPENRILIASTLASGEGLNLQFCSDCIMLERQWNPANEEQAEARFIRIGQLAQNVTATYFIAVGTVVEFFSEIVERKRQIVNSSLNGGESVPWDQTSLIKELSSVLAQNGGKRWGWK